MVNFSLLLIKNVTVVIYKTLIVKWQCQFIVKPKVLKKYSKIQKLKYHYEKFAGFYYVINNFFKV